MHKELELHVSGCLDHEGVVDVIYTVVIYRSGGTCFDPKVNLGYPFGKHAFGNTAITYISNVFTEAGIGDYTVAFKLSNTVNGAARRRWVVAMFESLYQSVYKQSNGILTVLTATRFGDAFDQVLDLCLGSMPGVAVVSLLGVLHHAQLALPAVTPVKTVKSLRVKCKLCPQGLWKVAGDPSDSYRLPPLSGVSYEAVCYREWSEGL